MDRKLLLAIGLMLIVAVLPSILWPPERPVPGSPADSLAAADTGLVGGPAARDTANRAAAQTARGPGAVPAGPPVGQPAPAPAPAPAEPVESTPERLVVVETDLVRYRFSARGGHIVAADLKEYRSFTPGDSGAAQVIPSNSEFLAYRFTSGRDTVPIADLVLEPDADTVRALDREAMLTWTAQYAGKTVTLQYRFRPGSYLFDVEGRISGVDAGLVAVGLGPRLRSIDADSGADIQAYGVVTKARGTERLKFRSLDALEREDLPGPFEWVAVKSKYFVAGVFTIEDNQPRFGGAVAVGGVRTGRLATEVHTSATLPAPGGQFSHSVFIGPQEHRLLRQVGHDFEDVNPYGWILRPVIRPFANFIIAILLWMHETLSLAYGWVLILFGIAVRVVLWPLNQKAMRSSTAMQAIQPEIKAIQERYKEDPPRLQKEMMKLYKEHGVNPLGGCLPMLIPMPVLFALFFVFANTIQFRGVSFLWLPDLSRADPLYIIPLLMGASMFAVSKLGQRGVPPNPQAKMMMYIMPPMFTFLFLRFSAGLNLYYAVSNIASIPQQWMISNERIKRLGSRKKEKG